MPDEILPDLSKFAIKQPKRAGDETVARTVDDELSKLGWSENARLSFLGDVGRENGWNRSVIFGGHADPKNKSFNRGIISWQGDRREKLDNYLQKEGVLGKNDDDELRGMVRFADKEMRENKEWQPINSALRDPNISTYEASENLRKYIKYVPDGEYNSHDPEFRVKNNAKWAKQAQSLGLGKLPDLSAFSNKSELPDLSQFAVDTTAPAVENETVLADTNLRTGKIIPKGTASVEPTLPVNPAPVGTLPGNVLANSEVEQEDIANLGKATVGVTNLAAALPSDLPADYLEYLKAREITDSQEARNDYSSTLQDIQGAYEKSPVKNEIPQPTQQQVQPTPQDQALRSVAPTTLAGDTVPPPQPKDTESITTNVVVPKDVSVRVALKDATLKMASDAGVDATAADIEAAIERNPIRLQNGEIATDTILEQYRDTTIPHTLDKSLLKDIQAAKEVRLKREAIDARITAGELKGLDIYQAMQDNGLISEQKKIDLIAEENKQTADEEAAKERFLAENKKSAQDEALRGNAYELAQGLASMKDVEVIGEDKLTERAQAALAKYGSFSQAESETARIEKEYEFRPLARPLEAVKNLVKSPVKAASSLLKSTSIAAEAIDYALSLPDKDIAAKDRGFYQLGTALDKLREDIAPTNKDFKGELATDVFPDTLGQVATQVLVGALSGGAALPTMLGAAQGIEGQYNEASEKGATQGQRLKAAALGGVLAAPDYFIFKGWFKGASVLERSRFLTNLKNSISSKLGMSGIKEAEAKVLSNSVVDSFLERATKQGAKMVRSALPEAAQEVSETKGNDLYAYLSYDPSPERLKKLTTLTGENVTEATAGFLGGLVGASVSVMSEKAAQLDTTELQETKAVLQTIKDDLPDEVFTQANEAIDKATSVKTNIEVGSKVEIDRGVGRVKSFYGKNNNNAVVELESGQTVARSIKQISLNVGPETQPIRIADSENGQNSDLLSTKEESLESPTRTANSGETQETLHKEISPDTPTSHAQSVLENKSQRVPAETGEVTNITENGTAINKNRTLSDKPELVKENNKLIVKHGDSVIRSFSNNPAGTRRANRLLKRLEIETRNEELNNKAENIQFTQSVASENSPAYKKQSSLLSKSLDRLTNQPVSALAASATFEVGAEDGVLKVNPAAAMLLRYGIKEATGSDPSSFFGAYMPESRAFDVRAALYNFRQKVAATGNYEAAQKLKQFIATIDEATANEHKDLAVIIDTPQTQEITKISAQEELSHRADFRVRNFQTKEIAPYKNLGGYTKAVGKVALDYEGASERDLHNEVIAKIFRDDAETVLGVNPNEIDEIQNAYLEQLDSEGVTPETFRKEYSNISNRSDKAIEKYEQRNLSKNDSQRSGESSVTVGSATDIGQGSSSGSAKPAAVDSDISAGIQSRNVSGASQGGNESGVAFSKPTFLSDFLKEAATVDPEFTSIVEESAKDSKTAKAMEKALEPLQRDSIPQTIVNLRRAGLLTGVKTHLKNISGNTAFQGAEEMSKAFGYFADVIAAAHTGERTISFIDPVAVGKSFKAIVKSDNITKESGLQKAKQILLYGDTETNLEKQQLRQVNSGLKALDWYVNGVFRTLSAEDALFKTYAFRRSLEEQATVLAITAKKTDAAIKIKEMRQQLLENPDVYMIAEADAYADYATFQNKNKITEFYNNQKKWLEKNGGPGGKAANRFLDTVLPFVSTPTNVVLRSLDYTPVGYIRAGAGGYRLVKGTSATKESEEAKTDEHRSKFDERLDRLRKRADTKLENRIKNFQDALDSIQEKIKFVSDNPKQLKKFQQEKIVISEAIDRAKQQQENVKKQREFSNLDESEQRATIDAIVQKLFTRKEQQALASNFGRATLGTSTVIMGFLLAQAGYLAGMWGYDDDRQANQEFFTRRKNGIEEGSLLIPKFGRVVIVDSPIGKSLVLGATMYEQLHTPKKKGDSVLKPAKDVANSLWEIASEQPFLKTAGNYFSSKQSLEQIAGGLAGSFVPTLVSDVGEVLDKKPRKMKGFKDSFIRRIPKLRENAEESKSGVSQKERGGVLRRAVRSIDPWNVRSPTVYVYKGGK